MPAMDVRYSKDSGGFELVRPDGPGQVFCVVPYDFDWTEIPSSDGIAFPLWASELPESQILVVVQEQDGDEKTIGYLCTVSALTSTDHEFAEDKYFRAAAGHAVQILLEGDQVQQQISKQDSLGGQVRLADVLKGDTCVIVCMRTRALPKTFDTTSSIYVQLHKYGISPYMFGAIQQKSGLIAKSLLHPSEGPIRKLKLRSPESELPHQQFIEDVFSHSLPLSLDPIFRFYLYYQLVELLMEEVMGDLQDKVIDSLVAFRDDSNKRYKIFREFELKTGEKSRIKNLFSGAYATLDPDYLDRLCTECKKFLLAADDSDESEHSCGTALYNVRNMLIHNMRRVSPTLKEMVPTINDYLEVLIPSLLLRFYKPKTTDPEPIIVEVGPDSIFAPTVINPHADAAAEPQQPQPPPPAKPKTTAAPP